MPIRRPKASPKPQIPSSSNAAEPSASSAQQYEVELRWCIQKLEEALSSNKLNPKQAQDTAHSLSVLKSKTAQMVKKRHMMRTACGDYRTKMAEEERKFNRVQQRETIAISVPSATSRFIKTSHRVACDKTSNGQKEPDDVSRCEDICNNIEKESGDAAKFAFHSSDNNFRFNFSAPSVDS